MSIVKIAPKIFQGLPALKWLGPRLFFQKLKYQFYSRVPHFCLGRELDSLSSSENLFGSIVNLTLASTLDAEMFFNLISEENDMSRYEILARKHFYDSGFRNCYIGRLVRSNQMASIVWMVTPDDVQRLGSKNRFLLLSPDEVYGENIYTLKKYRGMGVMTSTGCQQELIAKKNGYKRIYFNVRHDNIPSLKSSMKRGHLIYKKFVIFHFMFHVKMKIIEEYDPPIPISI